MVVNGKQISLLLILPFLLVLSTVFIVGNDLANGVVSGKYFWFYGSMGLVSLTTLSVAIFSKKPFRISLLDVFVLLFVGSVSLSAFVFNDASQNTTKLTLLALLVVLYFCLRIIAGALRATPLRWVLYGFIVLTGLVEAVWGLLQLYGFETSQHGLFKITGSFFNPGPYAGYLAVVFPLALQFLVHGTGCTVHDSDHETLCESKNRVPCTVYRAPKRWLGGITCITILLVLPAAMSRSSWLAAIAGSAIVLYKQYSGLFANFFNTTKAKALFRRLGVWIISCAAILLLATAFTGMYFLKKDSADGRTLTWKVSLKTMIHHPLGVGLGNFSGAYGEEQAACFASGKATETEERVAGNPEYGFNEYLQIGIESGIVSLLLFVGMIILIFRSLLKTRDWGQAGSLTALLVFACFSYPFSILPFLIVLVFLLSTGNSEHADDADDTDFRRSLKICVDPLNLRHLRAIISICLLLITLFFIYKQYPVYRAYRQWQVNQIYYQAGLFKDTAKEYTALYPCLNDQIRFLFEYAQCLSKSEQPEKSNEVLQRAMQISCDPMLYNIMGKNYQAIKDYERAESAFIKSTQLVPSRLYPWYLLTKLYAEMELPDKVKETAAIVLTKEAKVQSPAINEMREEVKKIINYEL